MPGVKAIHSGNLASTANSRGGPPTAATAKVTAKPRQPKRRAIRQVMRKIGTVDTVAPRKTSVMDEGDGSSGTRTNPAPRRGGRSQSPKPTTTAAPARARANRRTVGRVKYTTAASGGVHDGPHDDLLCRHAPPAADLGVGLAERSSHTPRGLKPIGPPSGWCRRKQWAKPYLGRGCLRLDSWYREPFPDAMGNSQVPATPELLQHGPQPPGPRQPTTISRASVRRHRARSGYGQPKRQGCVVRV